MNDMIEKAIQKIKGFLEKSDLLKDLPFLGSSVAEDYLKRIMEAKYDKLSKTQLFRQLKSLEDRQRLLIEFGFYTLDAFIKRNMGENTPLKAFAKGIITDFFPEMGKRLINGDTPEGKEIIEIVQKTDNVGNTRYASEKPKEKSSQPGSGLFAGTLDLLRKKLQNHIKGGKDNV